MEFAFECRALSKKYDKALALDNMTISLPKGKIVGLLGPNGSGKTTLIKIAAGLLTPTSGKMLIYGNEPGPETKAIVSYLPERPYFSKWMTPEDMMNYFEDFYADFDRARAEGMLQRLSIDKNAKMKTLSKGTKEKVQLVLVMSRHAALYLLDEPIGGVDPAARDFILQTIISNYNPDATVIISTHLVYDVEKVLDEFIFLKNGTVLVYDSVDRAREANGKSIDDLFREVFRC